MRHRTTPWHPPTLLAALALLVFATVAPGPLAASPDHHGEPVLDEVDFHFLGAHRALREARPAEAADELRTAAAFVALEARRCDRAGGELEKDLKRTTRRLSRLASRIERGRTNDLAELEQAFLEADHVLVRHHARHARVAWDEGRHDAAGRHLHAVADHLEHGLAWTGEAPGLPSAIDATRRLAMALVEGGGTGRVGSRESLDRHLEQATAVLASLEPYVAGQIARAEGVVTAYDPQAGTLSIRTGRGKTRTFQTDASSSLAGVAEGERVRLVYATDGRHRTVRTVTASRITGP